MIVYFLHPQTVPDHVGIIPDMLNEDSPLKVVEQLDRGYAHGGGWNHQEGFVYNDNDGTMLYKSAEYDDEEDDEPLTPLASILINDELIIIYSYGYVAVFQPDRSFEICRMD